jgi:cytochrome bd-type quinol oxidase subunit 2
VSDPVRGDQRPPELDEEERARRAARFLAWAQAGGLVFLAVIAMGMLPRVLSEVFPGLGEIAAVPVMLVAIAVPIFLLMVAAFKLPR